MKYKKQKTTLHKKGKKEDSEVLIEKIQPIGGITFRDIKYISTGLGYEACIHICAFPKVELQDFWLQKICNLKDTVVTIDISTDNIEEAKKNINKSIKEQGFRVTQAKDYEELYEAEERMKALIKLHQEVKSLNEVIKLMHIRIYCTDTSWDVLEEKTKTIMTNLETEGFVGAIFLNEAEAEWKSIFRSYTRQQKEKHSMYGQPLTAGAIAMGNPFHFSSLEDPFGTFLGKTDTGGNVLFDEFSKTTERLFYNFLATGEMGSGKSTLLKKIFKRNASLGNFLRTFDIKGEFTTITQAYGGKVIKGDGGDGILNPLQILKTGEGDKEDRRNEETLSFSRTISKSSTMYKFLRGGEATNKEINIYEDLLRGLYEKFGFQVKNGKAVSQMTELPPESYPIYSDFLTYIEEVSKNKKEAEYNTIESEMVVDELKDIQVVHGTIQNLVTNYGYIFDGHTTINNISDEQIVTFDISGLKNLKSEIFDAQIFNLISLCWDNAVSNGKIMDQKYSSGEIEWEEIIRFMILIDESSRWLNAKKMFALDQILIYLREARQYFAGIGLATQSIRDYVPDGTTSSEMDKLKTIFELTQYQFIFRQQSNLKDKLQKIFDGALTFKQIEDIPTFGVGHTLLCISAVQNLEFDIYLTDEEKAIFKGGV